MPLPLIPAAIEFLADPGFWIRWIKIVVIDVVLAGDNALVIALAVRRLDPKAQFWGRVWGTVGAVLLRVIFIGAVAKLMEIPLLRALGGVALVFIALKLVRPDHQSAEPARAGGSLREAVGIIIAADVTMSLDNVIAIAGAAQGDMVLVVFGLLLSIPLVVWGSGLLARLMNRHAWIIWCGGGVLGHVAGGLILNDPWIVAHSGPFLKAIHHAVPVALAIIVAALGWWWMRGRKANVERQMTNE
jgi:YjbE family integral membrane protein